MNASLFRFVRFVLYALCLGFTPALANDWNGDWDSSFGQLRLLQNGDRLYGDYAERGVIEGRISADGKTARAYFVYNDGRWGTVQWRIANDRIAGTWNWSEDGLPDTKNGKNWTATRMSARTSQLKYSSQTQISLPADDAINGEPFRTWFAFAVGQPSPTPSPDPRDGLSRWYGGFALSNINPAFDIGLDVIHYDGANTAGVDMSIFVNLDGDCPQAMHTGFCDELKANADSRGFVDVTITGVTMSNLGQSTGQTLEATFRLLGDRNDRVIRVYDALNWYGATIHHPQRGYDYQGYAQGRSNVCEQTRCTNDVFEDVRNNPQRYSGANDSGYINRLINLPDRIAESHIVANPTPPPAPQPRQEPKTIIGDAYAILEETSENLGEISFSQDGSRLAASGRLRGFFETGEDHDVIFTYAGSTGEAVAFDLTAYAGQSGESKEGRLLIELPAYARNNPRGTLIVGDDILLVELVRPTSGLDPRDVNDTPAIGIYSTSYRLRDVPRDRTMQLRKQPDRRAEITGSLNPNASGLEMLTCADEINSLEFQEAGLDRRLALLSSTWCQVTDNRIAGWLPGIYLVPEQN